MTPSQHFWEEPLYRLILEITALQVAVLVLVALGIVVLRLIKIAREKRKKKISAALYTPLMHYMAGDASMEETFDAIKGYPRTLVSLELEQYAMMLGGDALSKLRALYERLDLTRLGLKLSGSSLWWRRLEGIRLLGVTGGGDVVDVLVDGLRDNHAIVRLAAARSLGRIRSPKAIKPMLEIMTETQKLSRRQLAQTLVAFGPVTHPALRQIVAEADERETDQRFVATALEVLAITGDHESGPVIRDALLSDNMEVRIAAFKSVVILHLPLSSEELIRGLTDSEWPVRAQAAIASGKVGSEAILDPLGNCLTDQSWWVRQNAGAALYELGPKGIDRLALISKTSEDRFARDMAFRTLTSDPFYQHLAPDTAEETPKTSPPLTVIEEKS